jgi:phospholipid/cholesterol/gamma-HCH transport system substrate-binding protein
MPKPFHKRRANELVGIFVLATIAVLAAALLLGPNTSRWFTPTRKLTVRLPAEGSLGLRKGADVLILGSVVGSVDDILVDDSGEMEAEVSIRGNFIRFVRRDSKAIIRKPLGIGDASIDITRGSGEALPLSGATIQSSSDKAPTEMLEETLAEIRTEIVPASNELRTAVNEYTQLATDLRGQQPGLTEAIGHFNHVAANVQDGKGLAGMLISDATTADMVRQSLPKVSESIDDLRTTAATLRKVAATLPAMQNSARQSVDEAPALLLQAQETFRQIQRLTEAVQHNWLITGGSVAEDPSPTIAADRVGTDR